MDAIIKMIIGIQTNQFIMENSQAENQTDMQTQLGEQQPVRKDPVWFHKSQ